MSSALLKTPLRQVASVKDLLMNESARDQLSMVAAKHLNPERMMRTVANAIRTTPKLGQCEPISFLGALMQVAALGLEPNTVMGHAYLIPFENKRKNVTEVQVVIGYRGLIDLARRSGHITSISANIHYSDDDLWEYEEGTEAQLRHRPGPQDGTKLHAYAIAKFKDGGHAYVVLPWKHVIKIRDGSQGWQSAVKFGATAKNPWHTHEDAMAMKTAIRALSKYLPLSIEFTDALAVDEKKADYRGFAMDPTAGVTIEGEAEDADEAAEVEAKPVTVEVKAEPVKKAAPKAETRADVQYVEDKTAVKATNASGAGQGTVTAEKVEPEQASATPAQGSMLDEVTKEIDWSLNTFGRAFLADVKDMGFEGAVDLHDQQIAQIQDEKPGLYAYIVAESEKLAKA